MSKTKKTNDRDMRDTATNLAGSKIIQWSNCNKKELREEDK